MKAIFTYPNNSGTSFIDPTYIGDDTVGFQKRIKDLVDGNYKAWTGTIPSDTVTNIMSELSKFNDASQLEENTGNNSIYAFWNNPLYTANMELIESNISSATATDGVTSNVEFASNHGFYNSQLMTLSGFDGSWSALNGNDYYVKKIDSDTIQLATDSALTLPLEFYDQEDSTISSASIGGTVLFTDADASHDLNNGTYVQLSNFDNAFEQYNGQNFYIQNVTASTFNLSWDTNGSNLLTVGNTNVDIDIEYIILQEDDKMLIKLTAGSTQFPALTPVVFDPNDAVTHGPMGANFGLSTVLNIYNPSTTLYISPVGGSDPNEYYLMDYDPAYPSQLTFHNWQNIVGYFANSGQTGFQQAAKDAPTLLERTGNEYYYKYTFNNFGTPYVDYTGNKAFIGSGAGSFDFKVTNSSINNASNVNHPYYIERTGSQNDYYMYEDSARTTRQRVEYDIVNAKRIKYISSDPLVVIPKKYDSAGVEIGVNSFVLNADTMSSLTEFDTKGNFLWTTNNTNGIDNVPATGNHVQPGFVNPKWNRRVATYGPNAEPILDFGTAADPAYANEEVSQNFDSSSYTTYTSLVFTGSGLNSSNPSNGVDGNVGDWFSLARGTGSFNVIPGTPGSGAQAPHSDPLVNRINTMLAADPQSVYGVPFFVQCGYINTQTGAFVKNGDYYMVITQVIDSTEPKTYVNFKVYEVEPDGSVGADVTSTASDTQIGPSGNIPFYTPPTNSQYHSNYNGPCIRTYLEPFYDVDDTGVAKTITANSWNYYPSGVLYLNSPAGSPLSTVNTGQKCSINIKNSSGTVIATYNNLALLNNTRPNTASRVMFVKLDSNGNWDTPQPYTGSPPMNVVGGWDADLQGSFPAFGNETFEVVVSADTFWNKADQVGFYNPPENNYLITSTACSVKLDTPSQDTRVVNTDVKDDKTTTFDTTGTVPWTAATQGDVVETINPATPNIIPARTLTAATTGTLTIKADQPYRYRVSSVTNHMYGNQTYLQRTGASTYVNNATIKVGDYIYAGASGNQTDYNQWPSFTVPTNVSGYLTNGFAFDTEFPGAFPNSLEHMFFPQTAADTYTPPALTPAQQADVFDTDDQWADYGFANNLKEWPYHVTPSTATINYNSPTIVNNSQSGVKYSRSVGHTKWMLEVEYPPMTALDFQKFHAIAQAAQGQAMPFYFVLSDQYGGNILWRNFDQAGTPGLVRFKDAVATGDRLALIEGFASNQSNAFLQGEVIVNGANENGFLHTVLNQVDSNVYGEAKIRTPWPFRTAASVGQILNKNPAHCVVTLNSDNFEYSVDSAGYYYVSVAFDLDNWK